MLVTQMKEQWLQIWNQWIIDFFHIYIYIYIYIYHKTNTVNQSLKLSAMNMDGEKILDQKWKFRVWCDQNWTGHMFLKLEGPWIHFPRKKGLHGSENLKPIWPWKSCNQPLEEGKHLLLVESWNCLASLDSWNLMLIGQRVPCISKSQLRLHWRCPRLSEQLDSSHRKC